MLEFVLRRFESWFLVCVFFVFVCMCVVVLGALEFRDSVFRVRRYRVQRFAEGRMLEFRACFIHCWCSA